MTRFWVVGGGDSECCFRNAVGSREQWSGPFETYADAIKEWDRLCHTGQGAERSHFRIERLDRDVPPATD
jgi:hypothetical protein